MNVSLNLKFLKSFCSYVQSNKLFCTKNTFVKSVMTCVILKRSVLLKRQEGNIFIFKMADNYLLKYTELLHPENNTLLLSYVSNYLTIISLS